MKDFFCQKWKVKVIFQGVYRLSGTGIVECSEITDVVIWNSLAWSDRLWFTRFTTDLRHWSQWLNPLSAVTCSSQHVQFSWFRSVA